MITTSKRNLFLIQRVERVQRQNARRSPINNSNQGIVNMATLPSEFAALMYGRARLTGIQATSKILEFHVKVCFVFGKTLYSRTKAYAKGT